MPDLNTAHAAYEVAVTHHTAARAAADEAAAAAKNASVMDLPLARETAAIAAETLRLTREAVDRAAEAMEAALTERREADVQTAVTAAREVASQRFQDFRDRHAGVIA